AILRAAQVLDAPYVWSRHVALARDWGVTTQQMNELASWPGSTAFAPEQKAALSFAEKAAQHLPIDESAATELRRCQPQFSSKPWRCRPRRREPGTKTIKSGVLPCGAELGDLIECCLVSITLGGFNMPVTDEAD